MAKDLTSFKPVVLGVDAGYGSFKTAHAMIRTGVEPIDGNAIASDNVLVYNDQTYIIGESHETYISDKTTDETYFIMTLAATAEELKYRGFRDANIILVEGTPLSRFSREKDAFREYLSQDLDPVFLYQGKEYKIHISRIMMYPQGLAETALLGGLEGDNMILDIGNGTYNVARVIDGRPIETSLATRDRGVSYLVRAIGDAFSHKEGRDISESIVERRLIKGSEEVDVLSDIIKSEVDSYTEDIIRDLKIRGFEPLDTRLHVFGGGGILLKNYSNISNIGKVNFCDDLCANAKGYEESAKRKLAQEDRKKR